MNKTLNAGRLLLGSVATAALMSVAAIAAHAQDEMIIAGPMHATTYLNGGIGKDDENFMRGVAKDFSLRMIFSERKDKEFLADVGVVVTDKRGVLYLQLQGAGPMTYAKLPAGTYRVTATYHGRAETREVTLDGKDGRDVYFHWTGTGA